MAGGQAVTSGQGSVGLASRDLALTGSASTTATGIIDYSEGDILTGSEAATAAGDISTGTVSSVRLRSRKVGGGAASFLLTGAFSTVQQEPPVKQVSVLLTGLGSSSASGVFGKQRSSLPTGHQLNTSAGTVTPQSAQPDWLEPLPAKVFYNGTPEQYDLRQFVLNFNPSLHGFRVSPSLPADFGTMNSAIGPNFDGTAATFSPTNYTWEIYDLADADWQARSAGAVLRTRLDNATDVSLYTFQDGSLPHVPILDTAIFPPDGTGSARCNTLNTDTTVGSMMRIPFGTAYADGATFWVSFRVRATSAFAFQPWPTPDQTGQKLSIISNTIGSNQNNELVVQGTHMSSQLNGYYQDGNVTAIHTDQSFSSAGSATDVRQCPSIDRASLENSGAFATYPLTGTNPDTGAAWSAWEQDRARYGLMYSAYSTPSVPDFRRGLGDPISGLFRLYPDEFITITQRMIVGNFGQFNNRWTCWAARSSQPYVKLWDLQNIRVGTSATYNALWLVPYVSSRTSGGRQVTGRTNNITGCTIHTCGLSTPIGTGTLSYNSSTQRFTWAGSGESAGTARGFSAANGKTRLNVISTGNSYLIIEVVPGALPTSGIVNDTITIANGRPDVYLNYADVIVKTSAINAPGGYAPVG